MNYEDIQTFKERLRSGIAASDAASLQKKLLEEVADLRHYIELRLINKPDHYTGDTHGNEHNKTLG